MPPNRKTTCRVVCGRKRRSSERPRSRLGNWRSYTGGRLGFITAGIIRRALQTHLTWALIQALSGSAACKFVIEDFNELASPRVARRSRDRKWLISIHFGNYRLNARADIIIRRLILGGFSLLRQSHSPGSLPRTRVHRGVTLRDCPSRCRCKISSLVMARLESWKKCAFFFSQASKWESIPHFNSK